MYKRFLHINDEDNIICPMKTMDALANFQQQFEKEQYQDALNTLNQNRTSLDASIYNYNVGLINFKLDNFSTTKLHIERAKKQGFDSAESRLLLNRCNESLGLTNVSKPDTIFDNMIFYTNSIGENTLIIISFFFLTLLILNLKKVYGFVPKLLCVLFLFIPLVFGLLSKFYFLDYVALGKRDIYPGPSKMFSDIFEMPDGMLYRISKKYKSWGFVIYPDKYRGWIIINNGEKI